jgi:hypothetical protein
MPNNSIARREKEKKKQDKKKKTVPPPLHKEDKASKDKASMEGASLTLFDTGKDKASKERNSLSLSSGRRKRQSILQIRSLWSVLSLWNTAADSRRKKVEPSGVNCALRFKRPIQESQTKTLSLC